MVTMVGTDTVSVANAIPIVMGASIGTSVTNSSAPHGHIVNHAEVRLGFQGARTHSYFNLLCVPVLLSLEIIAGAMNSGNGGMLYAISSGVAGSLIGAFAETFKSPVNIIVGGVSRKLPKGLRRAASRARGPTGRRMGTARTTAGRTQTGRRSSSA